MARIRLVAGDRWAAGFAEADVPSDPSVQAMFGSRRSSELLLTALCGRAIIAVKNSKDARGAECRGDNVSKIAMLQVYSQMVPKMVLTN
jgi:hypothetical protein